MKFTTVLFLGPVGAGKGTHAHLLEQRSGCVYIGGGELLRGLKLSKKVEQQLAAGGLVSDAVIEELIGSALDKASGRPAVLDGFPRDLSEARWLDAKLAGLGRRVEHVIYLEVSDVEANLRLKKRGRMDDTPEAIGQRRRIFRTKTALVIERYAKLGLVSRINSMEEIQVVDEKIQVALGEN